MEDMWSVLMNVNAVTSLAVAVASDVLTLIYQQNMLALTTSLMSKNATE
jgi:hypothetical protein